MPLQKIKSGRVITVQASTYVGEKGMIFYDEDIPELRLSDGTTPGGIPFAFGGGTGTAVLVTATTVRLGGVKIGPNITVAGDGTISVAAPYQLPIASTATLGGIRVGRNLTIGPDGTLDANTATAGISDSFKTIKISGNTDLIANGEDTLEIVAGAGVTILTSATSSPYKTLTIESSMSANLDGGFPDTLYGGVSVLDGGGV